MIPVKSIYFLSKVPFLVDTPDGRSHSTKTSDTWFELGLGPCGRYVSVLTVEISERFLKIKQISQVSEDAAELYRNNVPDGRPYVVWIDTEIKEFTYKIEDVVGRITTIS